MDPLLIQNSIAIAHIGASKIAGVVTMVHGERGEAIPSFFTGHGDHPLPLVFMTDLSQDNPIRFEATGLTMQKFGAQNDREIDVYFMFAKRVFEENLGASEWDFYACLNGAVWLRDSGLVVPADFAVDPTDPAVLQIASRLVMDSKAALDKFVGWIREAAELVRVH